MWIFTTRPGFENDLLEELGGDARLVAPALISAPRRSGAWPTFARTGFQAVAELPNDPAAIARVLDVRGPWMLQTWVPDSDETNRLSGLAGELNRRVIEALPPELALRRVDKTDAVRYGGTLVQVCLAAPDRVHVGVLDASDAPTFAAGGRARSGKPGDAPSRAARKLAEAFTWIGRGPEAGDLCVDLGAAPGGWTAVLLARRAQVVAVDPAKMAPDLRARRGLTHLAISAFEFLPDEPVDWLFCDMAWRPLEVASLLAKWGRRKLALALVANVKLPMKQRVAHVGKVREIVAAGGWKDVRTRQLYHDREEITLAAWRT